jgi:hypothetical protein
MGLALIQELWVYGGQIRGSCSIRGALFPAGPGVAARSYIVVRNTVHAFLLLELCCRDVVLVKREQEGTYCYFSIPPLCFR